jgi:hypothetical protein
MKLLDIINEQTIGYTPDKIDRLVSESSEYVIKFRKLYESTYSFVLNLTIKECIETMEQTKVKLGQLEEFKIAISTKYDKYYQILDTFEVGEYPHNVKLFEQSINEIDSLLEKYDDLLDALKDIISNSEYISR